MKKIFFYLIIISTIIINGCDEEPKKSNNIPSAPELTSPTNSETDVKTDATLNWKTSTDKDGDVVNYNLFFDTKYPPTNLVSASQSGTNFNPKLLESTTYYWKVSVSDGKGGVAISDVWSFTTATTTTIKPTPVNHAPSKPELLFPSNNYTNLIIDNSLLWYASTDADGNAIKYNVIISSKNPPEDTVSKLQSARSYKHNLLYSTTYYWKVSADDGNGGTSVSDVWSFKTSPPPLSVPVLTFPLNGATNVKTKTDLVWSASTSIYGRVISYSLYLDTFVSPITKVISSLNVNKYTVFNLFSDAKYYWKIVADDGQNGITESEIRYFKTIKLTISEPLLISPVNDNTNTIPTNITFIWSSSNTLSGKKAIYDIYLGTIMPTTKVSSLQPDTFFTTNLLSNTVYFWKVIANDGDGGTTESEVFTLKTDLTPPKLPIEISPLNSATGVDLTSKIKWFSSITYGGKSPKYNVFFGTTPSPYTRVAYLISDTFYVPNKLFSNTNYYWKLSIDDGNNGVTNSLVYNFTTALVPPTNPILNYPANGKTNVPLITNLYWDECIGYSENIIKYNVYLDKNNPPSTKIGNMITASSIKPTITSNSTYYWKVEADDGKGGKTSSEVFSFSTIKEPPSEPVLISPAYDELKVSLLTKLLWHSSKSNIGDVKYNVFFDTKFPPVLVSENQKDTSFTPSLLSNTKYYWKIVAVDVNGLTTETYTNTFKTLIENPTAPILISPINKDVDVPINSKLEWVGSKTSSGKVAKYNLYLHQSKTDIDPMYLVSELQEGTVFTHPYYLYSNSKYYWKVVAYDGNEGITSSDIFSFTTKFIPTAAPKLLTPVNLGTKIPINSKLIWNESQSFSDKPIFYQVYFGTSNPPPYKIIVYDTVYTPTLKENTTYYWKLIATDRTDEFIESELFSFTTISPPSIPILTSPVDNDLIIVNDTFLTWDASTSPYNSDITYNVYFGTDNPPKTIVSSNQTVTQYNTPTLLPNTTYYWKIEAVDGYGGKSVSEVKSFIVFIMELINVEAGSFKMGCSVDPIILNCESDEKPIRTVKISKNYSIGKFEVTQIQWKSVMGSNPSWHNNCDSCPVENISWDDIQTFITTLNNKTGKNYRLPTEAEWEFAARGGNKTKGYIFSGSNDENTVSWNRDNSRIYSRGVGLKTPNELGIYDMSGNINEWISDWYKLYPDQDETDPIGPVSGTRKVLRGGDYSLTSNNSRITIRFNLLSNTKDIFYGFRLVLP